MSRIKRANSGSDTALPGLAPQSQLLTMSDPVLPQMEDAELADDEMTTGDETTGNEMATGYEMTTGDSGNENIQQGSTNPVTPATPTEQNDSPTTINLPIRPQASSSSGIRIEINKPPFLPPSMLVGYTQSSRIKITECPPMHRFNYCHDCVRPHLYIHCTGQEEVRQHPCAFHRANPDPTLGTEHYEAMRHRLFARFQNLGLVNGRPWTMPVLLHDTDCKHNKTIFKDCSFKPLLLTQLRQTMEWERSMTGVAVIPRDARVEVNGAPARSISEEKLRYHRNQWEKGTQVAAEDLAVAPAGGVVVVVGGRDDKAGTAPWAGLRHMSTQTE